MTSGRINRTHFLPGRSDTGLETMSLYHYSEDPNIARFSPRAPLAHPETEPFVWTIDDFHSPLYYLPRDCPRASLWPLPTTTSADRERFFGSVSGRMVIAIESGWVDRVLSAMLYRYSFDEDPFFPTDNYGAYITRETVEPIQVEPVGNLLRRLLDSDIELRICPSLVPLGRAIIRSTLHFSLIRMRNAIGWEDA